MPPPGAGACVGRLRLAIAVASAAAVAARSARVLTAGGAVAAAVIGAACASAGWDWAALLIAFFLTSTGLSRLGRARKELLSAGVVEKGGQRDAMQVLANGGAFAVCAIGFALHASPVWYVVGAGALAASTADTWATEVGMLVGGMPRSIRSWRPVAPGTSGAVTPAGTAAAVAGALFVGAAARALDWPMTATWGAVAGGLVGAGVDSLLGAALQARRWCDRCSAATERLVHPCGVSTRRIGGLRWLDNDGVNTLAAVTGALAGALVAWTAGTARS